MCVSHICQHRRFAHIQQLSEQIRKSSPQAIAAEIADLKDWQDELERLQKLLPTQASRDRLKQTEIPTLEKQIKEQEDDIPSISEKAEQVS